MDSFLVICQTGHFPGYFWKCATASSVDQIAAWFLQTSKHTLSDGRPDAALAHVQPMLVYQQPTWFAGRSVQDVVTGGAVDDIFRPSTARVFGVALWSFAQERIDRRAIVVRRDTGRNNLLQYNDYAIIYKEYLTYPWIIVTLA